MLAVIPKIETIPEEHSRDVYIDLGEEVAPRQNEAQPAPNNPTNNAGAEIFSQYASNKGSDESDKRAIIKKGLEEICQKLELYTLKVIQIAKGYLLNNQTLVLKNAIKWSYISLIVFSVMNAGLFLSLQTRWISAGAKTFSFCIVISLGSLSTLLWYLKYRVVPSKYQDMPYILSAMAWNVHIGIAESIAYAALGLGWLNMIGSQITSMIRFQRRHHDAGRLTPLFVFLTGMGIFMSFVPILLVRIAEFAIVLEREDLIHKKPGDEKDPPKNEDTADDNPEPIDS